MKKIIILLFSLLMFWNAFLTYKLNLLEQPENNEPEEVTVIQNRVNGFSTDLTEVVKKAESAAVLVRGYSSIYPDMEATGFVWQSSTDKVLVVTAYHVVKNAESIDVVFDNGSVYQTEWMGVDSQSDIALLKVTPDFNVSASTLGDSSLLENGEWLIALGCSSEHMFSTTASVGVVSQNAYETPIDLDEDGIFDWCLETLATDALLNNSNVGGPILNMAGEVVAMGTHNLSRDRDGFHQVISSNELNLIAQQLLEKGSVLRRDLGLCVLDISTLTSYQKSALGLSLDIVSGIYVQSVAEGSLAEDAGIAEGDILLSANDMSISTMKQYRKMLYSLSDLSQLQLLIGRENTEIEIMVNFE